jgi:hypothetical protein
MTKISKTNQKALREMYANDMKNVWGKDTSMIDYCVKSNKFFIGIQNKVIGFEKHRIENDFWFGYSDCGQGLSYEDNNKRVDDTERHLHDYFISRNTEGIERKIKQISELLKIGYTERIVLRTNYNSDGSSCYVHVKNSYDRYDRNDEKEYPMTESEIKFYISALEEFLEMVTDQCERYWKRYRKNISINTYWADR